VLLADDHASLRTALMPAVAGLEVCRAIRKMNPLVKVILLRAEDPLAIRDKGFRLGAFALLTKRDAADVLLTTIQEAHFGQD